MALELGSTLGHYQILSSLGAGGMGEVYRARDTKLGREVAIKLLLEKVSADPERLARFDREARVLASLNHPNIATLYGFEREGDTSWSTSRPRVRSSRNGGSTASTSSLFRGRAVRIRRSSLRMGGGWPSPTWMRGSSRGFGSTEGSP